VIGLAAWALAFVLALKLGAVSDADVEVIAQLRLPRAVLASALGMGLAVAGATLQALFANPLCEPYTLGISSGSALGAVLGASLGLQWNFGGLAGSSFLGALVFAGVLYLISSRPGSGNLTLLLAGVMLGFLGSSLVALWMALADANGIQGAMLWLMGDLSRARLRGAVFSLAGSALLIAAIWTRWRELDALLMGEEGAASLGVPVASSRRRLIVLSSLLIGLCVSGGGMIGFVGLVVPHFVRRLVGSLHLSLLPLSAIWGAAALTAADALARVLARPYELPVGVVTALVGAPLFLWIMLQRREGAS
jgi:iron complex transport system permease protein